MIVNALRRIQTVARGVLYQADRLSKRLVRPDKVRLLRLFQPPEQELTRGLLPDWIPVGRTPSRLHLSGRGG